MQAPYRVLSVTIAPKSRSLHGLREQTAQWRLILEIISTGKYCRTLW